MTNGPAVSTAAGISVVIATLGGPTLKGTIETLNLGSVVPGEILICIPLPEASRDIGFEFSNVRILPTMVRGQVAQRVEGFKLAKGPFVMQLDDDILLDHECVANLQATLLRIPGAAVAPNLLELESRESVYRTSHGDGLPRRIYNWLMNGKEGYREGTILKSGSPIGIVPDGCADGPLDVEWLAGGCVMHHKANLILENYFPFGGKAYCEDMIHSHLLAKKGVRLLIEPRATCCLEVSPPLRRPPAAFLRETYRDFVVRRYYMKLSRRGAGRMYLYYFLLLFRYGYLWIAGKLGGGPASPGESNSGPKRLSA
ncbi:MAG: glycosyltransferase family 2 protein [Sulfuritalea sp.]|nr:glycosyltransferase family 2 protein [Sulfuritalea sp.]